MAQNRGCWSWLYMNWLAYHFVRVKTRIGLQPFLDQKFFWEKVTKSDLQQYLVKISKSKSTKLVPIGSVRIFYNSFLSKFIWGHHSIENFLQLKLISVPFTHTLKNSLENKVLEICFQIPYIKVPLTINYFDPY